MKTSKIITLRDPDRNIFKLLGLRSQDYAVGFGVTTHTQTKKHNLTHSLGGSLECRCLSTFFSLHNYEPTTICLSSVITLSLSLSGYFIKNCPLKWASDIRERERKKKMLNDHNTPRSCTLTATHTLLPKQYYNSVKVQYNTAKSYLRLWLTSHSCWGD